MTSKKTLILLGILFLCALCFGGGMFYSQWQNDSSDSGYFNNSSAVDINLADKETLENEAGIGPYTAKLMIESREKDGEFTETHDLVERKIIGEGKFREISPRITVN